MRLRNCSRRDSTKRSADPLPHCVGGRIVVSSLRTSVSLTIGLAAPWPFCWRRFGRNSSENGTPLERLAAASAPSSDPTGASPAPAVANGTTTGPLHVSADTYPL